MGWSRFQFSLEPQKELVFDVTETATYMSNYKTVDDLRTFLNEKSGPIIEQGHLKPETLNILKQIVRKEEALAALANLESETFTERDMVKWKAGSSVDPTLSLLPPDLLAAAENILNLVSAQKVRNQTINQEKERIQKVFDNQARLRENIKSLEKMPQSDAVKGYLSDLHRQEGELKEMRNKINDNETVLNQLKEEIQNLKLNLSLAAKKFRARLNSIHSVEPLKNLFSSPPITPTTTSTTTNQ